MLPALAIYGVFVIQPLALTVQYSLYRWDGVGPATWVGLANYATVLSEPRLVETHVQRVRLVLFFSLIPVGLGLVTASVIHRVATGRLGTISRTVLFLPQVIPLVAAGHRLELAALARPGWSTRCSRPSGWAMSPGPGSATSTRRSPPSGSSASGCCWASARSCSLRA